MHELVTETAREAVAVAQALGYDIDARSGSTRSRAAREGGPDEGVDAAGRRGRAAHRDRRDQRRCRGGRRRAGVAVPLNRAFVQLIKGWETRRGLS